jgi:hypothetical protein
LDTTSQKLQVIDIDVLRFKDMTMTKVLETQNKGRIFQEGSEKPNTKKQLEANKTN